MTASSPMPAAFLGHGNPMNALDTNRYTEAWRSFGAVIERPRAILVISAHWYTNATAVTAMPQPRTIHDFYGFPQALFDVRYPCPGLPELADEVAEIAKPHWIGTDLDSWGIDHGTWSVLVHAFPDATIPVVQLSINALKPFEYHVDLAARLAPLRNEGVVIIGSGNVVHNLGRIDFSLGATGTDWNRRFDEAAQELMTTEPGNITDLQAHPDFPAAVPTPDHFMPLLYLAGLAHAAGRPADVLVDGYDAGSLSMTSYTLDAEATRADDGAGSGAGKPEPELPAVPPEDTNL